MMAPETVVTVETNKPSPTAGPPQQGGAGGPLDWIKINMDYFKTPPGILKLVELLLGILCMALGSPAWFAGGAQWFMFVAVTSFIITLLWVVVYLLSVREALRLPINWQLTELFNTAMQTLLYFIACIVMFSTAARFLHYPYGKYTAAAELFNTAMQTLLYFIACIVMFSTAARFLHYPYGKYTAAAVFGLLNTVAYAASTYFSYLEHRSTVGVAAAA